VAGADDCTDGIDNDGDTLIDAADPVCGQTTDTDADFFTDGHELYSAPAPRPSARLPRLLLTNRRLLARRHERHNPRKTPTSPLSRDMSIRTEP
jgi:hypothetical protein